jgi:hypothetical protein
MSRHTVVRILLLLLFVLNAADAAITAIMVPSGYAVEVNPIAAHFLKQGVAPFIAIKMAIVGVCVLFLYWRTYHTTAIHRAVTIILAVLTTGYGLVVLNGLVWWNLAMMGKLQRLGG